jgi:hypothetical protein
MIGSTLAEIRERIETLASDGGEYYLVCARTGLRPVPVTDLRFESRETARSAARATEQYRAALRRYDPRLPHHDPIVCQESTTRGLDRAQWRLSAPVVDGGSLGCERSRLAEFCHAVTAAIFETLSEGDYGAVETAVMDTYLSLAESVGDHDELCLCLLESIAAELDQRLSPARQERVLLQAATRLASVEASEDPVVETFDRLLDRGLVGGYAKASPAVGLDGDSRAVTVTLSEYALAPRNGRLPVIPVVIELYRRAADRSPWRLRATPAGGGWRVTLAHGGATDPNGLASVPVRPEE